MLTDDAQWCASEGSVLVSAVIDLLTYIRLGFTIAIVNENKIGYLLWEFYS